MAAKDLQPVSVQHYYYIAYTVASVIVAEYSCAARNSHAVEQGSRVMTSEKCRTTETAQSSSLNTKQKGLKKMLTAM